MDINEEVRWHDGERVTAEDVCFTVDTILDPDQPLTYELSRHREWLEGCEAQDGWASIRFTRVIAHPRERVSFRILPAHVFADGPPTPDHPFSRQPVGNGPMRARLLDDRVELEKVANAHQDAKIPRMTILAEPDPARQVQRLLAGEVQGVVDVALDQRPLVLDSEDLALKSLDLRSWWYVALDTRQAPLSDVRVRQALDLLLDRTELREEVIGVDPEDPNPPCEFLSGPCVQSSPFYNRTVNVTEIAVPEQAEELLSEAGLERGSQGWTWQGEPWVLDLHVPPAQEREAPGLGEALADQLHSAGIRVHGSDERTEGVDLLVGKRTQPMPEDVTDLFRAQGARNPFGWSHPGAEVLLDRYEAARTDTEAKDAMHICTSSWIKSCPCSSCGSSTPRVPGPMPCETT